MVKRPSRAARRLEGSTHRGRRLSKELARAWLVTVINPILRGLDGEQTWLNRRRWNWDAISQRFEHLRPVSDYIDSLYEPNFKAFEEAYPDARAKLDRHDEAVNELSTACRSLHQVLLDNPAFVGIVNETDQLAVQQDINVNEIRESAGPERWKALLAQYLVNNIETLPSYYVTAAYWNRLGNNIRAARDLPMFRQEFMRLEQVGTKLLEATVAAMARLKLVRNRYVDEFGFPPVPLTEPSLNSAP